jgi:hypothetical protein
MEHLILSFLGSFLGAAAYFWAAKYFVGDKVARSDENVSRTVQVNEKVQVGSKRIPSYNTPEKAALFEQGKKLPEQWRR